MKTTFSCGLVLKAEDFSSPLELTAHHLKVCNQGVCQNERREAFQKLRSLDTALEKEYPEVFE